MCTEVLAAFLWRGAPQPVARWGDAQRNMYIQTHPESSSFTTICSGPLSQKPKNAPNIHSGGEALHSLPRWGTPIEKSTFRTALHAALLPTVATAPNVRLLLPKIPASRMASPANVVFLSVFGTESAPETAFATCPGVAFPANAKLFVRRVA